MQTLTILQGIPGAGKSFIAKQIATDTGAIICSTDDMFIENGVYTYDTGTAWINHRRNQMLAIDLMERGESVIVDNTNIRAWLCKPYVQAAVRRGIPVSFIRATGDYPNNHGVPSEVVARMKSEMEDLTVEKVLASTTPF